MIQADREYRSNLQVWVCFPFKTGYTKGNRKGNKSKCIRHNQQRTRGPEVIEEREGLMKDIHKYV